MKLLTLIFPFRKIIVLATILFFHSACSQTTGNMQKADENFYLTEEVFTITPKHIEALRKLTVVWDDSESGAPVVDIYSFPFNYQQIGKQLGLDIRESDFESGTEAAKRFSETLGSIFEIHLQYGKLKPGNYSYKNPLYKQKDLYLPPNINNNIAQKDSITFTITEDHLKLLHSANADWLNYWALPGINSKRPFGDMTCFYLDMANILKIPIKKQGEYCEDSFTKQQIQAFDKLHQELFYVLQVFLIHAEIEPGNYYRQSEYGEWKKLSSTQNEAYKNKEKEWRYWNNLCAKLIKEGNEYNDLSESSSAMPDTIIKVWQHNYITKFQQAYDAAQKGLSLYTKDESLWINKGLACHGLQKLEEALESYQQALNLNPNNDNTYAYRAYVYISMGKPDLATQDFKKALSINSKNAYALDYLKIYNSQKKP